MDRREIFAAKYMARGASEADAIKAGDEAARFIAEISEHQNHLDPLADRQELHRRHALYGCVRRWPEGLGRIRF